MLSERIAYLQVAPIGRYENRNDDPTLIPITVWCIKGKSVCSVKKKNQTAPGLLLFFDRTLKEETEKAIIQT